MLSADRSASVSNSLFRFVKQGFTLPLAFMLLLLISYLFLPTKAALAASCPNSNFVTSQGQTLCLNGSVFRFIGVNRYNIMTTGGFPYVGCGGTFTDSELSSWFAELHQLNVTAVRFWLFQSFTKNGTDFSRFDYLLNLASQENIKLIPVFENEWSDCTQGGYKYNTFYSSGYLAPYGNYTESLKSYIGQVVSLYKDNPNILMWQIMNEAESQDTSGNPDPAALLSFASDISSYIRSLDPNHLISLGTMGGGQPGTGGGDYFKLHSLPDINILEYHDYGQETTTMPYELQQRLKDAATLQKPIFVGEAGIKSNCTDTDCFSAVDRTTNFVNKINAFFSGGGVGYLIWSYRDQSASSVINYDFNAQDSLAAAIQSMASSLTSQSSPSNCSLLQGDLNNDGRINLTDLSMLSTDFNHTVPFHYPCSDITGDGSVNLVDVSIFSRYYQI